MRISGAGWAEARVEAMDQILSFAAWINPPMLPVVSSTNTTSTTGRSLVAGSTGGRLSRDGSSGGALTAPMLWYAG